MFKPFEDIAEVPSLRNHLLTEEIAQFNIAALHLNDLEITFYISNAIVNLLSDSKIRSEWKLIQIQTDKMLEAISIHEFPPSDFLIYRNLKPILGYLKSNNHHAVQEWAIWAINILTQVEAANLKEQYIRLIIMHEGLVNIYDFIQATDTSFNVATVEKVNENLPVISTGNNSNKTFRRMK